MAWLERNANAIDDNSGYDPWKASWTTAIDVDSQDVEDLLTDIQLCQALATLQKGGNTSEHLKLHAICDSPKVTAMQELCTHAAQLEAAAKTMSRYQKGTLLWENAVKSFWHIDNIDTPSLKSSCKKYALMFHPDKLTSMSHTTKCVSGYRDKLIGIYAGVIEPLFRQLCDYLNGNPGEMPCQKPHVVKHLIIRKDEQITLRILCSPIKSDYCEFECPETMVQATIPGLSKDGSDDKVLNFGFMQERGEETKYRATVEEEGDADATIVVTTTRYFTNLLFKYVFSNRARMVTFKDVFSTSHQAVKLYTCYGHAFNAMTC